MDPVPFFIARTICHEDKDQHELDLHVRHNGCLFFLMYHTKHFVRSPRIRATYLEYLQEIRGDEVDFDEPHAFWWLLEPFEALIMKLAPPMSWTKPSTLSQYAFPVFFTCRLEAVDDKFYPKQLDKWDGWAPPGHDIAMDQMNDLRSWTHVYNPSQVILSCDRSEDILVKPPHRVQLSNRHGENNSSYFLTSFIEHGSQYQLNRGRATFQKIANSNIKAGAHISCLHGVVATEDGRVLGLMLNWIDAPKGALQYQYWRRSLETRLRWAAQIRETITELHKEGIVWGDAKLDNVLLGKNDAPWIIDFGGGHTPGWVDREKEETVEGDLQGLDRIVERLSRSTPSSDHSTE